MTTRICGLLLVLLSLIGCAKSVNIPTPPTPQDPAISGFIAGLKAVSIAATVQTSIVESLAADKQLTKAEAKQFKAWVQPLPLACARAITELRTDAPGEVRIANAARIINDAQRAAIIGAVPPKVKAAYIGVTAALDAVAAQLNQRN